MVIWKYKIELVIEQMVEMPIDSKVLSANMQGDTLCIWVLVNENNKKTLRPVWIYETGQLIDEPSGRFIDTVQDGQHVWHVFA